MIWTCAEEREDLRGDLHRICSGGGHRDRWSKSKKEAGDWMKWRQLICLGDP